MVGMFGGVKLGGGGKLVMGEVCRIRIRKSVAVSLNRDVVHVFFGVQSHT